MNRRLRKLILWGLRLCGLWVIVSAFGIPSVRVTLENPPQTVDAVKDHVCVHTRLIDEVPEWVMQRSLQLVREMGADTIVEFFPWAYIERERGQYDWRQTDTIVRHAENQGLRVIARMGFVPAWARPDVADDFTTLNYLPDDSYQAFANFVATFAERYAGTIDHIIIWNEPNLAFEWGYRQPNPQDYVRLLEAVYDPIREANPDVTILAGALAPTLEPKGSPNGLSDLLYLEAMYEAGASDYFDALAVHTYGFTNPPLQEPDDNQLNFRRAELLFEIMASYDASETPIYITETGWNDHPRWTQAVRPSQRVQYTIDAYRYAETNWDTVEEMCLWVFRYPLPTLSYPDNFTLITTDFQISPLYYAVQAYAHGEEQEGTLWLSPPSE
ncbi:MAG: cellulase family glycosylhydrolase [Chloroflexota bacterium]